MTLGSSGPRSYIFQKAYNSSSPIALEDTNWMCSSLLSSNSAETYGALSAVDRIHGSGNKAVEKEMAQLCVSHLSSGLFELRNSDFLEDCFHQEVQQESHWTLWLLPELLRHLCQGTRQHKEKSPRCQGLLILIIRRKYRLCMPIIPCMLMPIIPALWEAKVGRSLEVRNLRLALPTWWNPVSTKNIKIS